ncbi:MAG: hypothetical protein KYX65_04030 [Tabrizicola sp.]|nr:hypothetical protein [Tabrizicola sp.]
MTWLQRFITASGTSNLADGVAVAAWGWIASLLTRDALPVALLPVALRLPRALPAVPALVPSDRLERANGQLWSAELLTSALIGPALVLPFFGGLGSGPLLSHRRSGARSSVDLARFHAEAGESALKLSGLRPYIRTGNGRGNV